MERIARGHAAYHHPSARVGVFQGVVEAVGVAVEVLRVVGGFAIPEICFTPYHNMLILWAKIMGSFVDMQAFARKCPFPIGSPISPRRIEWGSWRGEVGTFDYDVCIFLEFQLADFFVPADLQSAGAEPRDLQSLLPYLSFSYHLFLLAKIMDN